MKTFKFSIIFMLLSALLLFSADKPDFNILIAKGKVTVKRAKSTDWVNVKSGDKLFADDMIQIAEGGYIGLVHSTGSALELKQSGNYTVSKLASQATAKKSNVTKKFTNFLVDEMASSDGVGEGNHRKSMSTLGAVERSVGGAEGGVAEILPTSSYYIDNNVTFNWTNKEGNTAVFSIKDTENNVIFTKELNGNSISVNLDELKVPQDECYYWQVSINGNASEDFCIFRINENEAQVIKTEISMIEQENGQDAGAIGELMKASYFEEKKLVTRANESYIKAINAAPEVVEFKEAYNQFLQRISK